MIQSAYVFGNNASVCHTIAGALRESGMNAAAAAHNGRCTEDGAAKAALAADGREIVLVYKNDELQAATVLFHNLGIHHLFVLPWDTHPIAGDTNSIASALIQIDNSKPRLDYLEIELAEGCNLNCKGCNEFSNIMDPENLAALGAVKRDLAGMKRLFWGIGKVRLMGGEPLINPDFAEFACTVRETFPDCDLRLLSNGLLIPQLKQEQLDKLKQINCSFDISQYPPTKKLLGEIRRVLDSAGIDYSISLPNTYFFKSLLREPNDAPAASFGNCLFTHCHALNNGFLSACSNQMYAYRLNDAYGLCFPTEEKIDIHQTELTGWEINELFARPHAFCRYCGKGMVPYRWGTARKDRAKAEDWLIRPGFINMKVAPFLQGLVKTPAKKLRAHIRKPKAKNG